MNSKGNLIGFLAPALMVFLALALQVQITLFKSDVYTGLRLNLADLILPFAGLGILASLLRKKSLWPKWSFPHLYIWLAALTLILAFALLNGFYLQDAWSSWALVNKAAGWVVLMAYLVLGGWLATNLDAEKIQLFLKTFVFFFITALLIQVVAMPLQNFTPLNFRPWIWFPIEGLMGNRNAYAFLFLTVFTAGTVFFMKGIKTLPRYCIYALWLLLPLGMLFNGSRAAMIVIFILTAFLIFIYKKKPWLPLLLSCLIGILLIFTFYAGNPNKLASIKARNFETAQHIGEIVKGEDLEVLQKEINHTGDTNRLKVIQDSIEMVKQNPVFGSGLGSALIYQQEKRGQVIDIIDNTPLWLLVETGTFGLLVFLGFYFTCLRTLWRQSNGTTFYAALSQSLLLVLIGFGFMCLFHEILYSRFLWFLLGLALVHGNQSSAVQTTLAKA